MLLNFQNYSRPTFRGDVVYKDRYIQDSQDQTREILRAHLEYQMGPAIFYYDQLQKEGLAKRVVLEDSTYLRTLKCKSSQKNKVDKSLLKSSDLNKYSFRERRENELYSGGVLSQRPDLLNTLKKAGIKSVLCLVPDYFDYKKEVESVGLKFIDLCSIKDSGLNVFDINGDLINQLINHPDVYASNSSVGKISGLKEFIKILSGESEDYPPPVYFGCQNGTDRTVMWYQLYNILKDEDMNKPLSYDAVERLVEFSSQVNDYFRW